MKELYNEIMLNLKESGETCMKIENLCINCMQEMQSHDGVCEFCGFDMKKYNPPLHHMPPFTVLAGKYLLGKSIGEGGFGITYIGMDLNLEVRVAIKEYYPQGVAARDNRTNDSTVWPCSENVQGFFEEGREKFINEARRIAKFRELPEIVGVVDFFRENQTAYIVMEYLDGKTLKEYLRENGGKISSEKLLQMLKPLILSLEKLHGSNLIHRDISPDNIMLMKNGSIKLLDFGGARDYAAQNGRSMSVVVKRGYAPEEQYRSRGDQGPWTDVYALCATMYRCITGEVPPEALDRLYNDELKPISSFGADCPKHIENVITKGLSVRKEGRYQSMEELYRDLYSTKKETVKTAANKKDEVKKQKRENTEKVPKSRMPDKGKNGKTKMIIAAGAVAAVGIALVAGAGIKMKQKEPQIVAKSTVTATPEAIAVPELDAPGAQDAPPDALGPAPQQTAIPEPTVTPEATAIPEVTATPEPTPQQTVSDDTGAEQFKNLVANEAYDFSIVVKSYMSTATDAVVYGAQKAADELGVTYNEIGPYSESDIADQVNMLYTVTAVGTSGVGLEACDPSSVLDFLQTCADMGITVVTLGTDIPDAPEGSVACRINTDNAQEGATVAEHMYDTIRDTVLNADQQVVIGEINLDAATQKIQQRGVGFINRMAELLQADGKKVAVTGNEFYVKSATLVNSSKTDADVVIQTVVPAQSTVEGCSDEARGILSMDNCIAITGTDQNASEGILAANANLNVLGSDPENGDVIGAGFDAGSITIAAVQDGTFFGAVTPAFEKLGYYEIYALTAAANGQDVEDVSVKGLWYDAANMDNKEISPNVYW